MDRPTMRGWWQDEDGAWHPPGTEPAPLPETEPELDAEAPREGGFVAEPEPQPEPGPEPDLGAEAEAELQPDDALEPEPEPEPEADLETEPELEREAEPEPTLVQTRPPTAPVGPVLPSRPVVEPDDEPDLEPEPEPTLVDTVVETVPRAVPPPRVPARPAPRPPVAVPPDEARWRTGHLIAAALAGLLIGAFIGAALKDDSPTVAAGSTTLLVTTTTSQSDVPGLFGTTAPSGFGSGGGQSQGGPNITAANPFGASATTSPTTVFGSGLTPTTTSGAVTPLTSFVGDGTFRVGIDIQPGTYRSNGPSTAGVPCSWERQATFGDSTSVIDADPLVLEPVQVTILPSDRGFRTARCQIWNRVG